MLRFLSYQLLRGLNNYVNSNKKKHISNKTCSVYFSNNSKGEPTAYLYKGRSRKCVGYVFKNEEKRKNYIDKFVFDCNKKANNKKLNLEITRTLCVGDVLYSSWGYEQTNIDFYLVKALVGKASVKIIKICGERKYTGDMDGLVIPVINSSVGDEMTKRVTNGNVVKLSSYNSASPAEYEIINGCKIYKGYRFSCYA